MQGSARWIKLAPGETKSRLSRLFVSLSLSLTLHAMLFSMAPGRPQWMTTDASRSDTRAEPLAVSLASVAPAPSDEALPVLVLDTPASLTSEVPSEFGESISEAPPATDNIGPRAPPAPAGTIFGPWYYPARYLHRRPTPLKPIWPRYPESPEPVRGRVVILLLINEQGLVDQHRIESSEPSGFFDTAVIEAFTAAQYAPALITGYKVKSQLLAEVIFEPGAPPQTSFSIIDSPAPAQGTASSLGKGN